MSDIVSSAIGNRSLEKPGSRPVDKNVDPPFAAARSSGSRKGGAGRWIEHAEQGDGDDVDAALERRRDLGDHVTFPTKPVRAVAQHVGLAGERLVERTDRSDPTLSSADEFTGVSADLVGRETHRLTSSRSG